MYAKHIIAHLKTFYVKKGWCVSQRPKKKEAHKYNDIGNAADWGGKKTYVLQDLFLQTKEICDSINYQEWYLECSTNLVEGMHYV